ncbi:hypothetical protein [Streptomyces sp. BBFR102]|uniref:hypothetical protein n=1 Tax=Streptomyces sp. BBFR102 TaxID=3448171 RepID=UPI003F530940
MTRARTVTPAVRRLVTGIVADGAFKALLGAAYLIGAFWLGELLGVSAWLMVVSGVALLIGGGAEITFARSRPVRTCVWLMVVYDSGWVLTALAGLLTARQGGSAGGEVWIGYQTAAPLVFATLLLIATPVPKIPDTRPQGCAH